jgi:hypothetical protein
MPAPIEASYSLEDILANDRAAYDFLQLFDNFKNIQGDFVWGGWYTSTKGALTLTGTNASNVTKNTRKLHDERFGLNKEVYVSFCLSAVTATLPGMLAPDS